VARPTRRKARRDRHGVPLALCRCRVRGRQGGKGAPRRETQHGAGGRLDQARRASGPGRLRRPRPVGHPTPRPLPLATRRPGCRAGQPCRAPLGARAAGTGSVLVGGRSMGGKRGPRRAGAPVGARRPAGAGLAALPRETPRRHRSGRRCPQRRLLRRRTVPGRLWEKLLAPGGLAAPVADRGSGHPRIDHPPVAVSDLSSGRGAGHQENPRSHRDFLPRESLSRGRRGTGR
jgi:hypothetical protein